MHEEILLLLLGISALANAMKRNTCDMIELALHVYLYILLISKGSFDGETRKQIYN